MKLAQDEPSSCAVIFVDRNGDESLVSRSELLARAQVVANYLVCEGVKSDDLVVVSFPKSLEHLYAMLGVWWIGACPLSINSSAPKPEIEKILSIADPAAIIDSTSGIDWQSMDKQTLLTPPRHPMNGGAFLSGGSTGLPKIIRDNGAWGKGAGKLLNVCGVTRGQTQLVSGPWYHNGPIAWSHFGLALGHKLVVMEKFDSELAVELIGKHQVQSMLLVPTMMNRIASLDGINSGRFISIKSVVHTSAVCPRWLKQKWIELVGAEKIYDAYGSTEGIGNAVIRGDEWLQHEGSVGKPLTTIEVRVEGSCERVPTGDIGELWWKLPDSGLRYESLGQRPKVEKGFASVGDLGWLDKHGYLYIADRRTDLIVSGGANIYPAEVEGVLSEHPDIQDVVVIGLPDDDWGARVHAIAVVDADAKLELDDIRVWCKERIAAYKAPRGFEVVTAIPRNEAGKVRRQALRSERVET